MLPLKSLLKKSTKNSPRKQNFTRAEVLNIEAVGNQYPCSSSKAETKLKDYDAVQKNRWTDEQLRKHVREEAHRQDVRNALVSAIEKARSRAIEVDQRPPPGLEELDEDVGLPNIVVGSYPLLAGMTRIWDSGASKGMDDQHRGCYWH